MSVPTSLPPAAAAELDRWIVVCRARPGALPEGCETVHRRLVRAVGRGELPGVGTAYLKVMPFPRLKDRLRYLLRPLPAEHEARLLRHLSAAVPDVPCPEPLAVVAQRRFGVPHLSVLVTRGLPVAPDTTVPFPAMARAAARLCDAGIDHPDLHRGNFVALDDGRVAVLDLQSARRRGRGLSDRERRAVAAKLLEGERAAGGVALVEAGLIPRGAVADVEAEARRLRREAVRRRIERCLRESTEFAVKRRWNGWVARRRTAGPGAVRVEDAAARGLWLGDRALEVLDGAEPVLTGAFWKMAGVPGRPSVYIPPLVSRENLSSLKDRLLEGHRRYLALCGQEGREKDGL